MKVLSPFGPKIASLKLSKNTIKKINTEVDKITSKKNLLKKLDYSNKLVGQVKQEFQLGTRTTLDILDAEQEFLDARVSSVKAINESNISLFQLLYYLGKLTPENINIEFRKYDPNKNYKRVKTIKIGPNRNKVIGNLD